MSNIVKPRMTDSIFTLKVIEAVEKEYNAEFVIEAQHHESENVPVALFYQEKPQKPEYSKYFIFFKYNGKWMIANGDSVASQRYAGYLTPEGFVHSRYVHDYRKVDNQLYIDGGNCYFRVAGDVNRPVTFVTIVDGNLCGVKAE